MDIVGLLRKERLALMGKVNAVDAAIRLLSGGFLVAGMSHKRKAQCPRKIDSVGVQR